MSATAAKPGQWMRRVRVVCAQKKVLLGRSGDFKPFGAQEVTDVIIQGVVGEIDQNRQEELDSMQDWQVWGRQQKATSRM